VIYKYEKMKKGACHYLQRTVARVEGLRKNKKIPVKDSRLLAEI
jgi:hypothetical protein